MYLPTLKKKMIYTIREFKLLENQKFESFFLILLSLFDARIDV